MELTFSLFPRAAYLFQQFLNKDPASDELTSSLGGLARGMRDEQLAALPVSSSAYLKRVGLAGYVPEVSVSNPAVRLQS
jgi:hypothetical protein